MLASAAADDPDSIFKIIYIERIIDQVNIGWFSVPGKHYQLQGISDLHQVFTNISNVIIADEYEENVSINETNRMKHFRIIIPVD